jgi:hypothetical protein
MNDLYPNQSSMSFGQNSDQDATILVAEVEVQRVR